MELHNAFKPMLPAMLAAAMLFTAVAATAQPRRPRHLKLEQPEPHRKKGPDAWRTGPRHEVSIKAGAFPFTMSCGHLGLSTGTERLPLYPGIFATPDAVAGGTRPARHPEASPPRITTAWHTPSR